MNGPMIKFVFDPNEDDMLDARDEHVRFKTLAALEEALKALAPNTILDLELFLRDGTPFELAVAPYVHVTLTIHNESGRPITFSDNQPEKPPSN